MRLISLLLSAFLVTPVCADTDVYVSVAGDKRIAQYNLTPDGKLTHLGDTPLKAEPGALTTDPAKKYVFCALRSTGELAALRRDPKTGKLTLLNIVSAGADPAQISTDPNGKFVYTAYYVAARVSVHTIGPDGKLSSQPIQQIPTADKAHAIVTDPTGKFAFVPHTGPNLIFQFRVAPETGLLSPNTPLKLQRPEKTGPRHLVFHPSLPLAYTSDEQGNSVTTYAFDSKAGTLTAKQTVSTLPKGFTGENATAEIRMLPTGTFLYVSNRGHDSIACFAIDGAGMLKESGQVPTEKTPRSFDLDPLGNYLIAAGEGSGKLAVYLVGKDGLPKRSGTCTAGPRPWWVMAVTRKVAKEG